jgi:ABC-type sugar transport system substrate-binding protein
MSRATDKIKGTTGLGYICRVGLCAVGLAAATMTPSSARADSKLIVATLGFPCGLNDFAKALCQGFDAGKAELPKGFSFELKTGLDFADNTALNNIIETSQQLNAAGIIIFPGGSAAQVPVARRACKAGVKVIIIDNPVVGLGECQSGYIAADNHQLGVSLGKWLIGHPPASKEVGIVTLQPGQYASTDARVKGFVDTIEPAGFTVVATVSTDLTLDKTRTEVTNMLTAHPTLGVIMSANDQMGNATAQAVRSRKIVQLTIDGSVDSVKRITTGGLNADATQHPYDEARLAVVNMAKVLNGETIPPLIYTKSIVVDASDAKAYVAGGGMQGLSAK